MNTITPENRDEVVAMLEQDEYCISALLYLYTLQTEDEKMAHTTIEENGRGFSSVDAEFLTSIAEYYRDHKFLTQKQIGYARKCMIKYGGQLVYHTYEPAEIKEGHKKRQRGAQTVLKWAGITDEGRRVIAKFRFPKGDQTFYDTLAIVKTIPGRRWNADLKAWLAPISMDAVEILTADGFELGEKLQVWYNKMNVEVSDGEIEVPGMKLDLYPFQKAGVNFIEQMGGNAIVGDQMGLGKTAQALAYLQLHPELRPAIVVCPATVKHHWVNSIKEWMQPEDVIEVNGYPTGEDDPYEINHHQISQADRLSAGPIIVINYDIIPNKQEKYDTGDIDPQTRKPIIKKKDIPNSGWIGALKRISAQCLILDECHKIKNSKALRTKALVDLGKKIPSVIGLSGTPIVNKPVEFYNIIDLCKPGLFPSWWAYAQEYCGAFNDGFGWNFDGSSNIEKLHEILTKHVMVRRLKKDVLKDLPEKQRTVIPLDITNKAEYNRAASDIVGWIRANVGEDAAEKAKEAEALVEFEKLKQLAVKGKVKAALKWIEDFVESGEKLVVFCTHTSMVKNLEKKFGKEAVSIYGGTSHKKRAEAVDRFQTDPEVKVFIGNVNAAGVGITLTAASNTCFLELPWTPGELTQAEDRIHRIGQTADSVNIWYLMAHETVEEEIAELLDEKQKVLDAVLDGKKTPKNDKSLLTELLSRYKEAA